MINIYSVVWNQLQVFHFCNIILITFYYNKLYNYVTDSDRKNPDLPNSKSHIYIENHTILYSLINFSKKTIIIILLLIALDVLNIIYVLTIPEQHRSKCNKKKYIHNTNL